jgi:hypothetical protein
MATITPPYADPGRASFETLDNYTQNFLLGGVHPELAPALGMDQLINTTLDQYTVVGKNGSGFLVKAVMGTHVPVGVVAQKSIVGATVAKALTYYQGNFNIDALVWDASWTTDALKLAAFNGAPTPTQIVLNKRGS